MQFIEPNARIWRPPMRIRYASVPPSMRRSLILNGGLASPGNTAGGSEAFGLRAEVIELHAGTTLRDVNVNHSRAVGSKHR